MKRRGMRIGASVVFTMLLVAVGVSVAGVAVADDDCPAVIGIGVLNQADSFGTEPSEVASGFVGSVFSEAKGMVDGVDDTRGQLAAVYIPYVKPYQDVPNFGEVVDTTVVTLEETAKARLMQCPESRLFVTGYTQGAAVASVWLEKVGAKKSAVPPGAIAGAALFSNPHRPVGAAVFPGTSQVTPKPVPGTKGDRVAGVEEASVAVPDGGGSAAVEKRDYGSLNGLVADFCSAGDLTCDIPENSELARAVISVGENSETAPNDPVAAMTAISDSLAWTGYKAAADIATNDIDASKTTIKYTPKKSISSRVADAANVRKAAPDPGDVLAQMATIGIGAVMTIAEDVLTPETIAAVATAGLADPAAGLAVLGAKVVLSAAKVLAPMGTQNSKAVFTLVEKELKDNVGLVKLATSVKYWDAAKAHGGYATTAAAPTGASAKAVTTQWVTAAVGDILASERKPVVVKGMVSSSSSAASSVSSSSSSVVVTSSTSSSAEPATTSALVSVTTSVSDVITTTTTTTAKPAAGSPSEPVAQAEAKSAVTSARTWKPPVAVTSSKKTPANEPTDSR